MPWSRIGLRKTYAAFLAEAFFAGVLLAAAFFFAFQYALTRSEIFFR